MDLKGIGANTKCWVDQAQVREYWRAHVNATLNFLVPKVVELVNGAEGLGVTKGCSPNIRRKRKTMCSNAALLWNKFSITALVSSLFLVTFVKYACMQQLA